MATLLKYLSKEQQLPTVQKLLSEIDSDPDAISTLCECLDSEFLGDLKSAVYPQVEKYCVNKMDKPEFDFSNVLKLSKVFPQLQKALTDICIAHLVSFLSETSLFSDDLADSIQSLNDLSSSSIKCTKDEALVKLRFLEQLVSQWELGSKTTVNSQLVCHTVVLFLNVFDEDISYCAAKITRWILPLFTADSDPIVWKTISALTNSTLKYHNVNGYVLWIRYLRYLHLNKDIASSGQFHIRVQNNDYWKVLQSVLVSSVQEHRKYALSIVQLTVQLVSDSFENDFIKWEVEKSSQYIADWHRFCVLYEFVGVDASLHQFEAGYKDIQRLMNPKVSKIPTSWALCLMATALTAQMDSIRRYALDLVLSLDPQNLSVFNKSGVFFLEKVFLSSVMSPAAYKAEKLSVRADYTCPHGEKVRTFVQNIFVALKNENDLESISVVARAVLERLTTDTMTFEYGRLYVTLGLLEGLKGLKIWQKHDLEAVFEKLFQSSAENEIMELFLQKLYLRLLLCSKDIGAQDFVATLAKFVAFNNSKPQSKNGTLGYRILNDEIEFVLDFCSENFMPETMRGLINNASSQSVSLECIVVSCYLNIVQNYENSEFYEKLLKPAVLKHPVFPQVLLEFSFSKLDQLSHFYESFISFYWKLASELSSNLIKHDGIWQKASSMLRIFDDDENLWQESVHLKDLWSRVLTELKSTNPQVVNLAVLKLEFCASCYTEMKYMETEEEFVTLSSVTDGVKTMFGSLASHQTDHRLKSQALGHFFEILNDHMQVCEESESLLDSVLQFVEQHVGSCVFRGLVSIAELLQNLLETWDMASSQIVTVARILAQIWDIVSQERLRLSQQQLHLQLVDSVLHSKVISVSLLQQNAEEAETVLECVLRVCEGIIDNSFGRRAFLPRVAQRLFEYQSRNEASFYSSAQFVPLLVRLYTASHLASHSFRLVPMLAQMYDTVIEFGASDIYTAAYGSPEESYRVLALAIFASAPKDSVFVHGVINYIVSNSATELHLFVPLKRVDGAEERKRVHLYTILLCMAVATSPEHMLPIVEKHMLPALLRDASTWCRAYIEWIVAYVYTHGGLTERLLQKLAVKGTNPALVMSYERACVVAVLGLKNSPEEKQKLFAQLLAMLVTYCTSTKVSLRHYSASLLFCMRKELQRDASLHVSAAEQQIMDNILESVTQSGKLKDFRTGDDLVWDLDGDLTLVGLLGSMLLRVSDRDDVEFVSEKQIRDCLGHSVSGLKIEVGTDDEAIWHLSRLNKQRPANLPSEANDAADGIVALQKKSGAWKDAMDLNEKSVRKGSPLIVMGSLVDKPPNLGGICRLCDVLGAGLLTLGDINYKNHAQFKNVAVTADHWLPMCEVKVDDIVDYLTEQKRNGYTLIGLEQTDKSVQLNHELVFPEKSLIVLGKEKEGIPGHILAELDFCVEIKQVGVIRSMNIQTATALIVHEYSLQHC